MPPCIPWVVYTSWYASLPYHPGYTTHPVHCRSPYYTPGVLHEVSGREALGSTLGITLGRRLSGASLLPFLLGLV